MTTAKQLVDSARAAGAILTLDGERVLFTPPKGWPKSQKDAFLADLRVHKPEIVVYLVSETRPARIERPSDVAACGSEFCAGCYAVGPNLNLHPPKGKFL